ncbi:MAG: cell division protein SepF [Acutalibacteraceae bacterium]|nr:cell division protein SepF [Acutalibacteraceae bacterium]
MGLLDSIKSIINIPEEDEFDDEIEDVEEEKTVEKPKKAPSYEQAYTKRSEPTLRTGGKNKTVSFNQSQMQVVLVKPDRFEDVTSIADHLNAKKTVVLNLEAANRDVSRRIIDFLSGVAYANGGNIRKVANSTFIIVPTNVDVMGELMLEDFEDSSGDYF